MATSMLELGVGTGKWDAGLKKAKQSLDNFTQANGGLQQALEKESQKMQKFVQMMGQMDSTAKTAKGQMNDYKATIEQLTMQYNRMSEAQKKTIGQDYLNSIDQIAEKYRQTKKEIEDINKSLGDMKMPDMKEGGLFGGGKLGGMLQVFGGNLMTKGAGMLAGLASEMGDMVKQGVELAKQGEGIRIAFERLGRGDILDGLRQATHGTVTDIELMKAAVKFNDFKLPLDELGTMLAFAQQKAKDTGQSVDYMVDSIVTGLGRKSLMILDNLGLSATEVKDRMKETGDMTKAVGAIIREQMAKAGDYVETAADRAAQANVSLQNKMEELGRKFAPVEEASSQLWTSMKIGILDVVGGPLARLLNGLTEAGRLKNMLNNMNGESGSGNTKVDKQLKKLNVIKKAGGSDYIFNSTLSGMMEDYNRQIMALDTQIKNGGKRPGAGSGESQDVRYLQQKMDALKIMRDQLVAGAKEINKPIKIESNIPDLAGGGSGRSGGGRGGGSHGPSMPKNIRWDNYAEKASMAAVKAPDIEGGSEVWKMMREAIAGCKEEMADYSAETANWTKNFDPYRENMEKMTKAAKQQQMAFNMGAEAAANLGAAFASMEDPAAKAAGTVISAIANIALGFAQASVQASSMGPWGWVAFLAAGAAAMATTISTVHSLTGYANGGVIKGNSYSGDNIGGMVDGGAGGFVGLNAGEVVLNAAQQNSLAQNLSGNLRSIHVVGKISGTDIILSADRTLMTQGKQLAVWGRG